MRAKPLMQPSDSAAATAIAAAFNLIRPRVATGAFRAPTGMPRDKAMAWAGLIGDCAKAIHDGLDPSPVMTKALLLK